MSYKLHRNSDGREWPSDTAPRFDPAEGGVWRLTQAGQPSGVMGTAEGFSVLGGPGLYVKLSKNQMRRHLFAHAPSMTPTVWASLFDAAADVSTKLYAQAYQLAETISCPLDTTDMAGAADTDQGLSILVGEGKITAGEKQAIIDNWPLA